MANTTLIIGKSGTGKSTSLRNLDPKETFILSTLDKPLPFRGYRKKYKHITGWDDKENNYFASTDYRKIIRCIKMVNDRADIKCLILDDFNYVMIQEFKDRTQEKGFQKYADISEHSIDIVENAQCCRPDLMCFIVMHNDTDDEGYHKIFTIGNSIEKNMKLEGRFATILHAVSHNGDYKFITQNDGQYLAKSPMGMFDPTIPNDLQFVLDRMKAYEEEESFDDAADIE